MKNYLPKIRSFLQSEDGPTTVEYAVMLALIVAVCISAINLVGDNTSQMYDAIAADMEDVVDGTYVGN